jgi:hypothetical protein
MAAVFYSHSGRKINGIHRKQFFFRCQANIDALIRMTSPFGRRLGRPQPPGNQSRRFPPSEMPTGPPSATGTLGRPKRRSYIVTLFIAFVLISGGVLSRLFPGRARRQAAARRQPLRRATPAQLSGAPEKELLTYLKVIYGQNSSFSPLFTRAGFQYTYPFIR